MARITRKVLVYRNQAEYDEYAKHQYSELCDFTAFSRAKRTKALKQEGYIWDTFVYRNGELYRNETWQIQQGEPRPLKK